MMLEPDDGRYVDWDRLIGPGAVKVCRDCGSLVTDTKAHDVFHHQVSRADRRSSSLGPIG